MLAGDIDKGRVLGPLKGLIKAILLSPFVTQKIRPFVASLRRDDLMFLRELLETGKVTSVIDRSYALSDVPEAIGYLEEGHARGKVVITVAG